MLVAIEKKAKTMSARHSNETAFSANETVMVGVPFDGRGSFHICPGNWSGRTLSNTIQMMGVLLFRGKSTAVCVTRCFRPEIIHLEYQKHTFAVSVCASHRLPKLPLS
jgi:hypothetical protein